MTKEEAKQILERVMNNNFYGGEVQTACKMGIEALSQPSLPSNLDEAAEKNFETMEVLEHENIFEETHRKIFKAGAEWMAGQGVTTEQIVGRTPLNGPNGITVFLYDFDGFEAGDKVVVQIRKK